MTGSGHVELLFMKTAQAELGGLSMPPEAGDGDGDGCLVLELHASDIHGGFDLAAAVCSHGLFMTAPNRWDSPTRSLRRPLRLSSSSSIHVSIFQPEPSSPRILISVAAVAGSLTPEDQEAILVSGLACCTCLLYRFR